MTEEQRKAIMIYAPVDKIAYLLEYIDSMLQRERDEGYRYGFEIALGQEDKYPWDV